MANIHHLPQKCVRKSACTLTETRVWKASLRLYPSHILIKGWSLKGSFRKEVNWSELKQVDWFMVHAPEPNLILILEGGDPIPLRVKAPGLWKFTIDDTRPRETSFDEAPLPTSSPSPRQTGT